MSPSYTGAMFVILLFLCTVGAMEGFAYIAHRWFMHGPGWFLHASHHRPRVGWFELNDVYAAIFALPSIGLIYLAIERSWGGVTLAIGLGIAFYGLLYFVFHDVLVHRRIAHRHAPRTRYMKRIIQAHRLHHAIESKHGAVSFGFLYAPKIRRLKRQLRSNLAVSNNRV